MPSSHCIGAESERFNNKNWCSCHIFSLPEVITTSFYFSSEWVCKWTVAGIISLLEASQPSIIPTPPTCRLIHLWAKLSKTSKWKRHVSTFPNDFFYATSECPRYRLFLRNPIENPSEVAKAHRGSHPFELVGDRNKPRNHSVREMLSINGLQCRESMF